MSKKVLQNIQGNSRTQVTASLYGIILSKTKDIIRDIKYMMSARA